MKTHLWSLLLGIGGLYLNTCGAWANSLVNGDFEGGTYSSTGDNLPNGWTLGPPSNSALSKVNVDNAVNAPTDLGPESGSFYLRFQSPETDGSKDCVYQDFSTVALQQYTVSFWVAITSTSVGNTLALTPVWDENQANQTYMGANQFYFAPTNTGPVAYQFFSFAETASTNLTRIDFHGVDANGSILVDNVVVAPSPEPGSLALLGCGLGLVGVRRRRAS